jgi:hypothetical protein
MTRLLPIFGLLLLITVMACNVGNTPKRTDPNANSNLPKSGPAEDELLETLQGRWQSQDDSTYVVEIIGNKMRHYNENKLSLEVEIEINGACDNSDCASQQPGTESDGWCFSEKDPNNGVQCNVVTKCDKQVLQYTAIGSVGHGLYFKRL